jgi:acetoacetyl-CoA synthetase
LKEGIVLNNELVKKIKTSIREAATPRHVPAKIIQVKDIPKTLNGKKVEIAVTRIINGDPETENKDAIANPESLEEFRKLKEVKED